MKGTRFSENAAQSLLSFLKEYNCNIVLLKMLMTIVVIEYLEPIEGNARK
jgi:hypothetical protein